MVMICNVFCAIFCMNGYDLLASWIFPDEKLIDQKPISTITFDHPPNRSRSS